MGDSFAFLKTSFQPPIHSLWIVAAGDFEGPFEPLRAAGI
jgi:hypothetical protein